MAQPLPNPSPNQNPRFPNDRERGNRSGVTPAEQRRRDQFIPKDHTPEEQAAESRRVYDQELRAGVRENYQPEDIGIEGARRFDFDALTHSATEVAAESNRRAEYDTNYVSWLIHSQMQGGVDGQGNQTGEFGQGVGDPNYRGSGDPSLSGPDSQQRTGQIGMSNVGNRETRGYPASGGPRPSGESDAAFEVRTRWVTGQNPNDPRNPQGTRREGEAQTPPYNPNAPAGSAYPGSTDPRSPQGAKREGETQAAFEARTRGATSTTGDGTRIDDQGRRIDAQGRVIS